MFFDIECIPQWEFTEKDKEKYEDKINFMPEFNKIFCISIWEIVDDTQDIKNYKLTTLEWDEKQIIENFFKYSQLRTLIGYNIKGFDLPFIIKRALYLGIKIPWNLRIFGKKPWEIWNIVDLAEAARYELKFWGSMISLDLLCKSMGIVSPKEEWIDGGMVAWLVADWKGIDVIKYCERDVEATMDLYMRFIKLWLI